MINKKIQILSLFLPLLLCCMSSALWAGNSESETKWSYLPESCASCDFDVDVEVIDSYCDQSNGSISLDVSGGAAPYTYLWNTGETTSSISGLADLHYLVTITDANGCSEELDIDVDDDSSNVDANIYPDETTCGLDNGSISSNVSGGVAPYVFEWDDGFVGAEREDLEPGTYCVTVTDALGCTDDLCATVEQGSSTLGAVVNTTPADCDDNNGTATVLTFGGNPPYEYEWSNGEDDDELDDLEAGTYILTITDDDDCEAIITVVIEDDCPPPPCSTPVIASILIEEAHCGMTDGQVTITMVNTTVNYTYTWSPNISNNNTATNIPSGTYSVTISDPTDATCNVSETFTVGTVDGPSADLVTTNADCSAANGTATFTPSTYEYDWNTGSDFALRTDLASGNYQVTITDPANPSCPDVVTVVIGENQLLTYEVVINQEPDCGASNGSVTINVLGGSGNYSYSWGAGNTQTNLSSGIYCVDIVDLDNGCTATACFSLDDDVEEVSIDITSSDIQVSCPGDSDGEVVFTINEMNAATPLTVTIEDVDENEYDADELPAGSYCILVTDANDCAAGSACFEVIEPEHLDVDIAATDVTCDDEGMIALLFINGGTAPYTILWSTNSTNTSITNLDAGDYSFTLTDANGCSLSETVTIEDNAIDCEDCTPPVIGSVIVVEAHCNESDGQATINMASTGSYNYTWSPNVSNNNTATNIASGTYNVTIVDATDPTCFVIETFTVGTVDGPQADLTTTNADCGAADGTAIFTPSNYTYLWNDGTIADMRTDLSAGDYQVTITDPANPGCTDVVTVTIGENPTLTYEVITNQLPDCNQSNGSVTINIFGGSGDYGYTWSNGGSGSTQDGLASGVYCVAVVDNNNGCEITACFSLNDNVEQATITVTATEVETSCPGSNDGTVVFDVAEMNAALPLTITIEDAAGNEYTNGMLPQGNYCVLATDANGCAAGSDCFEVVAPEQLDVDIAVTDVTCLVEGKIELLFITGGTAPYTIAWSTGSSNSTITPLAPGDYSFTLTDANGCSVSETVTVDNNAIDCEDCITPIIGSIVVIEAHCNVADGQAIVTMASPGTFTYEWSGGVASNNTATELASGTYTVTITDLANLDCPVVETFTVGTVDGPEAELETTNADCGSANGTATFTPSNFTYTWNDGTVADMRTDLAAGNYQVTITDPATPDCPDVVTVNIGENPSFTYEVIINQLPECNQANGSVTMNAIGGSGDYIYTWSNGSIGSTQDNLSSGAYCVTIVDNADDCSVVACFGLNDNVPLATITIDPSGVEVSCPGSTDGTVLFTVDAMSAAQPLDTIIVDANNNEYTNGMLAPGNYCIFITDANGCAAGSECFEVTTPEQLDVDIAITPVTCESPGNINLQFITGGTAPYIISWSTMAGGPSLGNLTPGDYSFTLTDANGCFVSETLTVNDEAIDCDCVQPVITSVIVVEAHCTESDGSATVNILQNPASYSFDWSCAGCSGQSIADVAPGTYSVTITDLTDTTCFVAETFTIGSIDGPEPAQTTITPATCIDADGTVVFSPDTLTYTWNDGTVNWQRMDLAAGEYQVTVSDDANPDCIDVLTIIVGQTNPLELEVSLDVLPDCQMSNGEATITVTAGGSGDYTYSWGAATQTGLSSGTYTVLVTDNITGCAQSISFVLNDNVSPAEVNITNNVVSTSCPGAADGAVVYTVTPSPGFNGTPVITIVDANGFTVGEDNLGPGEYCILVTDADGCLAGSGCFEVTDPSQIDVDIAIVDESCTTTGSISLSNIIVGTDPYTIVWPTISPAPADVENLSDLQQGVYAFTLTDANGCFVTENVTVDSAENNIDILFTPTSVGCEGDVNGAVTAAGQGGTPDYQYLWNTGAETATITDLGVGTYLITVTDEFGCFTIDSITLTAAPAPPSPMLMDTISCEETIFLDANSPGNVVSWFNCDGTPAGPNPLEVTVLDTACYYVEIMNSFNCVTKDSITVIEAPSVMADFTATLSPCSDTAFVQFTDASTTSNGGVITEWDWEFSNGDTSDEQNPGVSVFENGNFIVTLTAINDFGCMDTYTDTIPVNILNNIAPPDTIFACPGENASLYPGADSLLTYNWSPANSVSDETAPNPMSTVSNNTTYMVTITSADGLCEVIRTVELNFLPMLSLAIEGDTVLCEGGSVDVSGITNGTEINWFDENGLGTGTPVATGNEVSLPGLDPGSFYYAIATDANQCTMMDSISIEDYSIGLSIEPLEDICAGDSLLLDPLYALAGGVPHDFMWTPVGMDTEVLLVSPEVTTNYEITVSNEFCEITKNFDVTVRNVSQTVVATANPDTIFLGETSQLEAILTSGSSFKWSNENTLDQIGIYNPTASPLETTDYTVTITDDLGCEGEATTRVTIIDDCDEPYIFFPNAFSPNDDGHNDVLYLRGFNADEVHFVIYNRWGEKLYESFNQDDGWDGSYKGERLCSDVYGFYLEVRCRNGENYVKKGNVTLLR